MIIHKTCDENFYVKCQPLPKPTKTMTMLSIFNNKVPLNNRKWTGVTVTVLSAVIVLQLQYWHKNFINVLLNVD